jgi:hypothetical protein
LTAPCIPRSWARDPARCDDAGIPTSKRDFATKPALALANALITRALDAKVPAAWVAGDEVYGADPRLRAAIRDHGLGYVLAVSANRRMPTAAGPIRVDRLPAMVPIRPWQKHSAGARRSWPPHLFLGVDHAAGRRRLRHRVPLPADPAATTAPANTPTCAATARRQYRCALGAVAGQRWRIEESFQAAKRPHRAGPAPAPPLNLLAPLDHPGHARPCLPGRGHRHRT